MSESLLKPGEFFAGQKFEIVKLLGKGGMSEVYEAKRTSYGGHVALKLLGAQYALREDYLARLKAESVFYSVLSHPNIVRMLDADQEAVTRRVYIVMELLRGRTLRQLLVKNGSLKWVYALHVLNQIADAMTFAHAKGILHRDLKPENVMVSTDPANKGHTKVLDFGIAKYADSQADTGALPPMGTARYMAPEQVRSLFSDHRDIKIDGRADIYGFGGLGYETITGVHMFVDDTCPPPVEVILNGHLTAEIVPIQDLAPDCPDALAAILHKCLEKDRDKRYATFRDLWDDLNSFRVSMPAEHPLAKAMVEAKRLAARRRVFESAAGVLDEAEQEDGGPRPTLDMAPGFMPPSSALPFAPSGPIAMPVRRVVEKGETQPLPMMGTRPPHSSPSFAQHEVTLTSAPSSSSPWSVPVAAVEVSEAVRASSSSSPWSVPVAAVPAASAISSPLPTTREVAASKRGWHVVVERAEAPGSQIMPPPPAAPPQVRAPRSVEPRSVWRPQVYPVVSAQPPSAQVPKDPPRLAPRNSLPLYVVGPAAGLGIAVTAAAAVLFFFKAPASEAEAYASGPTALSSSRPTVVATSSATAGLPSASAQPPPEPASTAPVAVDAPAVPAKRSAPARVPALKPTAPPRASATSAATTRRAVIPVVDDEPARPGSR